jgi:hypothetical protein
MNAVYCISLGRNSDEILVAVKTVMKFPFHKMEDIYWQAKSAQWS